MWAYRATCDSGTNLLHVALLITIVSLVTGQHLHETANVTNGETVRFNCSTESLGSADWHYRKTDQSVTFSIFFGNSQGGGGSVSNSYKSRTRYTVDVDITEGRYDLIIKNVTKSDEGIYTCSDTTTPDAYESTQLTVYLLEETAEECPYDEVAITGAFVQLRFPTTQSESLHVEHRSTDRTYPLHVFRDGKIVNDYYVLSGRFSFNRSDETWNLLVKNVQLSDAGTYICSEDNGMGKQYTKELLVIDKTVGFEIEGETCTNGEVTANVTCTATFSGHNPPRLQLRRAYNGHEGGRSSLNKGIFLTSPTAVHLITEVSGDDMTLTSHLVCAATTPTSYIVLANWSKTSLTDVCQENAGKGRVLATVLPCLLTFTTIIVVLCTIVFFKLKKKKKEKKTKASRERSTSENLLPDLLPERNEMPPQAGSRHAEET